MSRWSARASRRPRKAPSVAEQQLLLMRARPVHLPEGADPELGRLFGLEERR